MNNKKTLLIAAFIGVLLTAAGFQTSPEYKILFEKAKFTMETKGDLNGAITLFTDIIKKYPKEREYAAKSQLYIGLCYEKLGNTEARKAYEIVLRDYADQGEPTKLARERLSILTGGPAVNNSHSEAAMRRIWIAGSKKPAGISQDGRYTFFEMNGDLWLHDLQTGEERGITREGSWVDWTFFYGHAAISPDGKQVAYTWMKNNHDELRLSAIDGSSMRVLHNGQDGRTLFKPTWMPDGRRILAQSFDNKNNTYQRHIISLPDGTIRDIGKPESGYAGDWGFEWGYPSPDGRYIAYGPNGDILIYDTATDQESILVQNPASDFIVNWMPNGSGILFVSDRSGTRDLYLLGIENGRPLGAPELLRHNMGESTNLYLARDGRLFQVEYKGTNDSFITQVDQQTGKPIGIASLLEPNYPNASYPRWSSDGKMIYYQLKKGTSNEDLLFMRLEATGQTREITLKPKLKWWYRPVMSPNGHKVAVTGMSENMNWGIFAIDLESSEVSQLAKIFTENEPVDPCQNWSPDSKAIFFKVRSMEQSEEFIIRRKDLETGEEKDIYRGFHTRDMEISPDGSRFVYFRNDNPSKSYVLGILDIQSGKELELWRVPDPDEISDPTWAPDGRHVFMLKNIKQGTELWRFPSTGGPGEQLHLIPGYIVLLTIHPNGTRIAFTQFNSNYELWVLENFLPK